tara:strand:+ start:1229 stop:1945 length:717 start_codon:yes stop_codon:yes gene_type:complete
MKIVVPSYKRAGNVLTRKVFPDSMLAIHEFEEDLYKEKEGGELLIVPDNMRGNIAKVRNYILDNVESERIIMADDDIRGMGYHENGKQNVMNYKRLLEFIDNGYSMCKDLGARLWGVNLQSDPMFYHEFQPITLLGVVLGTFSCHYKPELRYDESLYLNEDYDFFLKNILKYRKVLRYKKYYYMADHLDMKGGCGAYRLKDTEIEQAKIMQKRWGSKVFRFDIEKSTNGRVRIPIPGT